ncbi:MAG: HAD family phosphatase [Chloroflexi bacterium]|nr:HAD family phosphatase [Chloroflexota bacterium]
MVQAQAVVLDLDGLIVDTEPLHQRAFNALLKQLGVDYEFETEEYGRCFVGIPVIYNADYVIERFNLRMQREDLIFQREQIYEGLIADPQNLITMPGVFKLLEDLRARGLPLAVASGSPRVQVLTVLRGLGIIERFRAVVAGDDVAKTKPAPDVYLRATEKIGIPPGHCVALEDSATGVTAAKAAGLRAIAVPNQYTSHQDLSHADARIPSLQVALEYVLDGQIVR